MADGKRFGPMPAGKLLLNVYGALQAEAFNRRMFRDGLPEETELQQMLRERFEERRLAAEREA